MKKKMVSIFLSLALLFSVLPIHAFAIENRTIEEMISSESIAERSINNRTTNSESEEIVYESLADKPELTEKEKAIVQAELIKANDEAERESGLIPSEDQTVDAKDVTADTYVVSLNNGEESLPVGPEGAPQLQYRLENEIQVKIEDGIEYSIDNGERWTSSGNFTNVNLSTEYIIISRYAKAGETPASAASQPLIIPPIIKPKAPNQPTIKSITQTSVSIKLPSADTIIQYSIDNGQTWQKNSTFYGLEPGTEYAILAYYPEQTGELVSLASEYSEPAIFTTVSADAYLVSSEAELLSVLDEIANMPTTSPQFNVQLKNDITVSDTVVLSQSCVLDLSGFTLTCTKTNVPVIEINPRDDYEVDSSDSINQIQDGKIVALGTGCGICANVGTVVRLSNLTFDCDIAVQNRGEIDAINEVQGRIKNNGHIGIISGISLVAKGMDEWEIYNEGTIDEISECTFSGGLNDDVVWHGLFDESRVGYIHNLGYIGEINNTIMRTERPIVLFNGEGAEINVISKSQWDNYNFNRGSLCLNFGTINTIKNGRYEAWNSLFLNYGKINHILGGWFNTRNDSVYGGIHNRSKEDQAYLVSINDIYSCFGNWGAIKDVSGGIYYGGYGTYGRGYWWQDGWSNYQENMGPNNRTWVDWKAFNPQTDNATFSYRDGYGMSRSFHESDEPGLSTTSSHSGFKVGKLYKVAYDMSEAACYTDGGDNGYIVEPLVAGTWLEKNYNTGEYEEKHPDVAPDYLYYCEGDTVYTGDPFARHRGWSGAEDWGFIRVVKGQYLDAGKLTQVRVKNNETGEYEAVNKWKVDSSYQEMYVLDGFEKSDPQLMSTYTFKMPAHDIKFTPKWRYRQPVSKGTYSGLLNSYGSSSSQKSYATTIMLYPDFEQVIHPADNDRGYSWGVICYDLDKFVAYNPGVAPVSGWAAYQGTNRPFHYEWSLDTERWYLSGQEAPVDDQVKDFLTNETGENSNGSTVYIYIKSVPNAGSHDSETGVSEMEPVKVAELVRGTYDYSGSSACPQVIDIPNGNSITRSGKSDVFLQGGLGTANSLTNSSLEVQVAFEDQEGNLTPINWADKSYDFYMAGKAITPVKYHSDILRCGTDIVKIRNIPAGTKVKARWRQYTNGYIMSEKSPKFPNAVNKYYGWYFGSNTLWSDWATVTIKKDALAPENPPVLVSRTETAITVAEETGKEYSINGGETWQSNGEFVNLTPGTQYNIISRYCENDWDYASSYSPALVVKTKVSIAGVQAINGEKVAYGTSKADVQLLLAERHPQVSVSLSNESSDDVPVTWKVADSEYNSSARGVYVVYGTLELEEMGIENPNGYQAEIEVEVLPDPKLVIDHIDNPLPITVRQYAMLSNEENKTTEFGPPTIFPKLPEKVTVTCEAGSTELPAKWNVWECDTTQVGEQIIKGYPDCNGTEYTNPQKKHSELIVNVVSCDYMFIDATLSDISLEVLPGTTVEELNALLKEEEKQELPLYMFDLDSGDQMITFYPLTLKEEYCPNYQMDIPGDYDFIIPWPDNILPSEEGELPELKVTVHVSEPLEIVDVELETIEPYQSVPVGHERFPTIPSQVNVTLEGGMKLPVDVVWDWSSYNEDLAAEQLIIGELVNLPSKAKQPEGQEFTGKLKATVIPVAYEITALLSDDPLVADAGLTLSEITQILQPVLTYQITSVTEGISLTLTRDVAVSLEDEKNPQYDPMDAYEDFVVGTLDLPDNITYDSDSGLDMVPLFTFPVEILEYVPCTVIAREGTDFADIPNKPVTVTAKLSSVGPDGLNKTAVISVNWGTGEGYEPYPADLTDDTCVGVDIEGSLVNKPRYIAATRKKPVLTVSVCREFDIEELSPDRIPGTGELEVPLGSSLEDIYGKLDQHTIQLTLKSTNGVFSQQNVSFELCAEQNPGYDPAVEETSSYTLVANLLHADNIKNPKGLHLEIHIKTMTYDISTAKVSTIKGIAKGTAFEDLPLPEAAGAVRDDGETEFLPTTWDNSKYNPTKLGGQFINGTFNTPLPLHLKNPDNRQPKAYITIVDTEATVLSMEQVFEEPTGIRKSRMKTEEIPGYTEHKYLLKLQTKDGTIREEVISLYSEEK